MLDLITHLALIDESALAHLTRVESPSHVKDHPEAYGDWRPDACTAPLHTNDADPSPSETRVHTTAECGWCGEGVLVKS